MLILTECSIEVCNYTAQKRFPADLVTFTEEILNGKLHILCSDSSLLTIVNVYSISGSYHIYFLLLIVTGLLVPLSKPSC